MAVGPGTRLGAYEVVSSLGAGGMGEVYRARDTRLPREVAIKVLRDGPTADAAARGRLLAEARSISALKHTNVCTLHDIGREGDHDFLVMELIDGETLADRLHRGPIPPDQALLIARQIIEGLDAAHERGIVHRDLKPANIRIAADGTVKLLDFGLARASVHAGHAPSATESPTLTAFAPTEAGVILGTPAYMSPEQARGLAVDKRTDIWAFGCVLYEMLAGRRAFNGATVTDLIAAILTHEPDWSALPASGPAQLAELVRQCLVKDTKHRLRDVGDARVVLTPGGTGERSQRAPANTVRGLLPWGIAAVMGATALALLISPRRTEPDASPSYQFSIDLPKGVVLPLNTDLPALTLSADGTTLVFVGEEAGRRHLFVEDLRRGVVQRIDGTDDAVAPFFTPDGRSVAFLGGWKIRVVALDGSVARAVHLATPLDVNHGMAWLDSERLIYAASQNSSLAIGSATGERTGDWEDWKRATESPDQPYAWPSTIPGSRFVLLTESNGENRDQLNVSILSVRDQRVAPLIHDGTNPRVASAFVLFGRSGGLFASPFDAASGQVTGSEVKLIDAVASEPNGAVQFAVAENGTLAYVSGAPVPHQDMLIWVDRTVGSTTVIRDKGEKLISPRLSAGKDRLAVTVESGAQSDIWELDDLRPGGGSLTRRTFATGEDFGAVWNPNGRQLALSSEKASDGPSLALLNRESGQISWPLEKPPAVGNWDFPTSWSSDGRWIAVTRNRSDGSSDIEVLPVSSPGRPVSFAAEPAEEYGAMFSPVAPYLIAYVSTRENRPEIYVRPFPGPGEAVKVSTNGGTEPLWNPKGLELFYREGDSLKSVTFDHGRTAVSTVMPFAFETSSGGRQANYDVSSDGRRFLVIQRKNVPAPTTIHVVLNWPAAFLGQQSKNK